MTTIQIIIGALCLFLSLYFFCVYLAKLLGSAVNKKDKSFEGEVLAFILFSVGFYLSLVL